MAKFLDWLVEHVFGTGEVAVIFSDSVKDMYIWRMCEVMSEHIPWVYKVTQYVLRMYKEMTMFWNKSVKLWACVKNIWSAEYVSGNLEMECVM